MTSSEGIVCSTKWKHGVDLDNIGGTNKKTGQIMVALHAAEWKSRYQSPLPTYCNWGDCEASLQGQDDWGGRKAVLCSELNGAGALHSYRASTEDRVIQPNEILQHTSSQSAGVDFQARSKRITTLVLRYEASKYEQELQKKVEKNKKKKHRASEDQT